MSLRPCPTTLGRRRLLGREAEHEHLRRVQHDPRLERDEHPLDLVDEHELALDDRHEKDRIHVHKLPRGPVDNLHTSRIPRRAPTPDAAPLLPCEATGSIGGRTRPRRGSSSPT